MRRPNQLRARPWVEWFANRIDDPVSRLKFLRTVTPLVVRERRHPFARFGLAAGLLLAILGSFFIIRASGHVWLVTQTADLWEQV